LSLNNNNNYVCKYNNETIKAEPWYFGKMKRFEAEKQLLLPENDDRAFLIRDTESTSHAYSLSCELIEHIISRLNML